MNFLETPLGSQLEQSLTELNLNCSVLYLALKKAKLQKKIFEKASDYNPNYFWAVLKNIRPSLALLLC